MINEGMIALKHNLSVDEHKIEVDEIKGKHCFNMCKLVDVLI